MSDSVLSGLNFGSVTAAYIPVGSIPVEKISVPVPVSVVVVRRKGLAYSAQLPGTHFVETSLEQLAMKPSAVAMLRGLLIGTVILEDLRADDLPPELRDVLRGREGVSCPVVTRWTRPDPNA
ncbi:hypothetical protein [Methylorubrum extorquens]|uniref:hypothetical protein n=1 Tax=Methylorubrum extorquens TaxID=408 RepID=UPI0020A01EF7|nr:hypothetical protein [Methylorubrum extorquens]MCP1540074.1 hypothetical protein [Methylorubrum extorquens]